MNKANIVEIFKSIQGEGKYAGVTQVFIRFYKCNMHCIWCDTPQSIGDTAGKYDEYSVDKLLDRVLQLKENCHSVSLTGGEPMLQKDFIKEFLPYLKRNNLKSYLETNGILYKELQEIIDDIDFIAMDIKLPTSTKCQPYWEEHREFLKVAQKSDVFVKAVISNETSQEDIIQSVELVSRVDPDILFILQPNCFEVKNGVVQKCLESQNYCTKRLNNVRIMPQIHKFIKLP